MTRIANAYISGIRLANLEALIHVFGSRKKFCEASGTSYSHLSQMFLKPKEDSPSRSGRGLGPNFCRKLEKSLHLGENCLDRENGVAPYLTMLVMTHGLPAPTLRFESEAPSFPNPSLPQPPVSNTIDTEDLSALEVATVDALTEAMRAKKFSRQDCMALLTKCLAMTEEAVSPESA